MINFKWNYKSGIYMIYNKENDKKYIGSSINMYERLHKHFSLLRNNKHENQYLQNAFNKSGVENFDVKILKFCNEEELLGFESIFCEIICPEYNLTKDIIRNAPSPETILKIKETLKEGYRSKRIVSLSKKPICIYNLKGEFLVELSSIKETCQYINCTPSSVNRTARGLYKQINGFQVFYKGQEKPVNLENIGKKWFKVIVSKNNDVKIFNNYTDAAKYINVNRWVVQRKMQKNNETVINSYTLKHADIKRGELLEHPNKDNQQPSQIGIFERFND